MSFKEVLGAIGLWVIFLLLLKWILFLAWTNEIFGIIIFIGFLLMIFLSYIAMLIWGGESYRKREVVLRIFVMSFLFFFAFLIAGTLFGDGTVILGIFISPLIALLHIEVGAIIQKWGPFRISKNE